MTDTSTWADPLDFVLPEELSFTAFPKIPRLNRNIIITEKIDGTNAAVGVSEDGQVWAQSRKRIITPEKDNYGFAAWVAEHEDELRDGLGHGIHFGEWWGLGIQRGYGLDEKRFSLFNVGRWSDERPDCCHVVPILEQHVFSSAVISQALQVLGEHGSVAAPGFLDPEGLIVYHTAANCLFKVTLDGDDSKGFA